MKTIIASTQLRQGATTTPNRHDKLLTNQKNWGQGPNVVKEDQPIINDAKKVTSSGVISNESEKDAIFSRIVECHLSQENQWRDSREGISNKRECLKSSR